MNELWIKQILVIGLLSFVALFVLYVVIRRRKSKNKLRRMAWPQKVHLLNELAEPFGFCYIEEEEVFSSRRDAWQRKGGYEALYDKAAPSLNMILDAWPVYFEYKGCTWLIEFWKGQYGINTGGEVGVYRTREIVPPFFYPVTHFDAVEDVEMPEIYCTLERKENTIYCLQQKHWWLTGFRMGLWSRPKDLRMMSTITFQDVGQAEAFYEGLRASGRPANKFRLCQNSVYVRMDFSVEVSRLARLHRLLVQSVNWLYCQLYRIVTAPFQTTVDRMLFLYEQMPRCFRRMLRLARRK